jgi:plasmid stability protein
MAKSITIRNVPTEVRDELAARAAGSGLSLQEYIRQQLIETASLPEPAALLARARERVHKTRSRLTADAILGHRDADRC